MWLLNMGFSHRSSSSDYESSQVLVLYGYTVLFVVACPWVCSC